MDARELIYRQSWSLAKKIDHSLLTIETFLSRTDGNAYVSFSGGKDSTCLLDLCRIVNPDIKAVFCNTGNEYPDVVRFVKELRDKGYNIEMIHPKITPKRVMSEYGFPLISKENSYRMWYIRNKPDSVQARRGMGLMRGETKFRGLMPQKWMWLKDEKFEVHNKCCDKLKKEPFKEFEKSTGLYPILGTMASESNMRTSDYIRQGGCNVFGDKKHKTKSMPLSIWMEEDIWAYIKERNLKIADIYHKGADRTGCMFCGYGCQFKEDNRLQLCYELYPKMYNIFMNYENNGVTYREALRKVLSVEHKSLPDEQPPSLFDGLNLEY